MEKEAQADEDLAAAAPIGRYTIVFAQEPAHTVHTLLAFVWDTDPHGVPYALTERTLCGIVLDGDRLEDWSDPGKNRMCKECVASSLDIGGRDAWRERRRRFAEPNHN